MSVHQLLATHSSQDLAEWRAYELVYGFADPWVTEAVSDVHEQLQYIAHILGVAHLTEEGDADSNPIPPPQRYPRPYERRRKFSYELDAEEAAASEG